MHHNVLGDQTCAAQNCDILNIKKNKLHNIIMLVNSHLFFHPEVNSFPCYKDATQIYCKSNYIAYFA